MSGAMPMNFPRRHGRRVAPLVMSVITGTLVANASLVVGWGSLSFFSSPYRVLLSAVFSLEVLLARLLENTDTGIRTVERQAWVALFAPFWIAFNIALAWTLHKSGTIPVYSVTTGILLFSLGLGLRAWSAHTLGRFFSLHVTIFAGQRLITHGPYAITRHPAYLGSVVQIVGLGFMFHAPLIAITGLLVFGLALVLRIRDEESLMSAAFPDLYSGYQEKVAVFFPWGSLLPHRGSQGVRKLGGA